MVAARADAAAGYRHRLDIREWDVLLVGDGSGQTWERVCGWAAILVDRQTRGRRVFYGAANMGSNNFAECLPYLQALTWFDQFHGRDRLKASGFLRGHVVTDSQAVATWANQALRPERSALHAARSSRTPC